MNSVHLRKPSLEDVFLHYTGRNIRDDEADSKDRMRMMHRVGRH